MQKSIRINEFLGLSIICWDIASGKVSERQAFHLYIDRWGHLDEELLSKQEKKLIEELTKAYGRGYFFPRAHGRSTIDQEFLEVAISENEIDQDILVRFIACVSDESYPGMRNGVRYFWRQDYEAFLSSYVSD